MIKFNRISLLMMMIVTAMMTACGAPPVPTLPVAPTREPVAPTATIAAAATATVTETSQPPTAAPTNTPAPTIAPTTTATPQPIAPLPTSTLAPALSEQGPWLIYQTDQGVMAVNADGTGQRLLTDRPILRSDLPDGASSNGWLALRIGARGLDDVISAGANVTLTLLHLSDGQIRPITPLFSSEMLLALTAAGFNRTDATEAGIAIMQNSQTLAWSPNGRYLAFIAAIDGPSSDVYSYDLQTGQINRLTDGPNQAANLNWSPDSQWVVHEEVEDFGTGAGLNVKAVWAAAPDGNTTQKVYDAPEYSGGEEVIGWTTADTFLVYTFRTMGPAAVRMVNVNTGTTMLLDVDILETSEWYGIKWSALASQFYINAVNGVSGVGLNNQVTRFAQEALLPAVSPDGQHLAFWINSRYGSQYGRRDGLRTYAVDGQLQHEIDPPVDFATWRPDARGLFFVSNGKLWYTAIPAEQIAPIDDGVQISFEGGLGWVR